MHIYAKKIDISKHVHTHTLISHNTSYRINNRIFVKLSSKLFAVLDNAGVYMVMASGGWIRMKQ